MELITNLSAVTLCTFVGFTLGSYVMFIMLFKNEQDLLTELDCKTKIIEDYAKKKKTK